MRLDARPKRLCNAGQGVCVCSDTTVNEVVRLLGCEKIVDVSHSRRRIKERYMWLS